MTLIEASLAAIESPPDKGGLVHGVPWGDWQFWITTAVVLAAVLWIARSTIFPIFTARRRRRSRVTLTMDGQPVKKG